MDRRHRCLPLLLLWTLLSFITTVQSSPISDEPELELERRGHGKITAVETEDIYNMRTYAHYAVVAYAEPPVIMNWTCGKHCLANPWFHPIAAGGDGSKVQFWYVGYDVLLRSVIVAHQGTVLTDLIAVLTDTQIKQRSLNNRYFPGLSPRIRTHDGFADQHEIIVEELYAAVKQALDETQFKNVTIIGHSLGGALATISGLYLQIYFPNVYYKVVTYGSPRIGNKAFATYVDNSHLEIIRVTNKKDIIPTIPGLFLGFRHTKGERHIQFDGRWLSCPGNENSDKRCIRGLVRTFISGRVRDHAGPYDGVSIRSAEIG